MISQSMQSAINEQIRAEMYSSYLYLSMCAYYESVNLKGFAHWMRVQADEERLHALRLFDYLNARDGRVLLGAIEQPPQEFKGARDLFEQTLTHEKHVTALIHKLYEIAQGEKDYATMESLRWFITEQVEEEANASAIVEKLKLIGESNQMLYLLDRELGGRAAPQGAGGSAE